MLENWWKGKKKKKKKSTQMQAGEQANSTD